MNARNSEHAMNRDAVPVPPPPPRRRLVRRVLLALGAVLALLLVVAAVRLGPLLLAPNAYAHVVSIEARPDYRAPAAMQSAWALPAARAYARTPFEFQHNQSFCGPASIANLLHSVGVPLSQEAVIDGTRYEPWFGVLIGGMTLDELADLLALRLHRPVKIVRAPTLPEFRALMASANDPARRVIVNFHRGPLFGRGHGHFSPVLGYLADRDLVLVGDVNARFRPFLAPADRLWRAAGTIDPATGRPRGLLVVDVAPALPAAAPVSLGWSRADSLD